MEDKVTDYEDGESPVPMGSIVHYGSNGFPAGNYEIIEHAEPANHPFIPEGSPVELDRIYPDGTAYHLWPVWIEKKFGNRHHSAIWVRRTSFTVKDRAEEKTAE